MKLYDKLDRSHWYGTWYGMFTAMGITDLLKKEWAAGGIFMAIGLALLIYGIHRMHEMAGK